MTYRWFRRWTLLTVPLVPGPFVIAGMMFVEAFVERPQHVLGAIPILFFSIILSYFSMAYLLNSTRVQVEGDLVTVRHGPVPWKGAAFRLKDCKRFEPGKLDDGRFAQIGVRITFFDGTSEALAPSGTEEVALEWCKRLNLHVDPVAANPNLA
ncbi:MAG: hypothetical protein WC314_20435 [Vulcanimicrobiota bacterium]